MRKLTVLPCLLLCFHAFAQPVFQLAPPMLHYSSGFFKGSTSLSVAFNQPGTEIHYSVNGKEPTEKDPVYRRPITIVDRTIVRLKAFGKEYLPSETVSASFIKDGIPVTSISYSRPNDYYAKATADILHDNKGGIVNYRNGGWLGYDNDTVTIDIELAGRKKVRSLLIDLLQDENAWIFLPEKIEVLTFDGAANTFKPVGTHTFSHEKAGSKQCLPLEISTREAGGATKRLKLVLYPLRQIPEWHSGKGKHGWLFIDEIKVY